MSAILLWYKLEHREICHKGQTIAKPVDWTGNVPGVVNIETIDPHSRIAYD